MRKPIKKLQVKKYEIQFICIAAIGAIFFLSGEIAFSQNIGISTDGSSAEAGVMLDVKGTNSYSTTATQNIFQVKSFDASGNELKLIMI